MADVDVSAFTSPAMPNVGADSDEPAGDSQPKEEPTGDEPEEEGADPDKTKGGEERQRSVPFHKHPRWIERENQWKAEIKSVQEATAKQIDELKSQISTRKAETKELSEADIPDWFNGDLESFKKFDSYQTKKLEAAVKMAEEGAVKRIEGKSTQETKAIEEATTYFRAQLSEIEGDETLNPSGEPLDQNKLLEIARDNDLVDSKGRWNWKAAARIYSKENPANAPEEEGADQKQKNLKKNIAALTMKKDSKSSGAQKSVANADSFKGKGWDNL